MGVGILDEFLVVALLTRFNVGPIPSKSRDIVITFLSVVYVCMHTCVCMCVCVEVEGESNVYNLLVIMTHTHVQELTCSQATDSKY